MPEAPQSGTGESLNPHDRRPLIAGNWKMFKTRAEARHLVRELVHLVGSNPEVEILICPPFTALVTVAEMVRETPIQLGAQNVHWEDEGAFTGEVSAAMLTDCYCRYVIIGHSERRQHFLESDPIINQKLKKVLDSPLTPILCVGESLQERELNRVQEVIFQQLQEGLRGLTREQMSRIILAYEPVWAIGTGKTATPEIAEEVHHMIRGWLEKSHSADVAATVRILYGGSVKPDNIAQLMSQTDIDGALVGGASLDAESFARIVNYS